MSTVTVKQKAPVFGAILLIIYALHTGFTSISNLFNIIVNAISAFSTPDYVGEARITLLFNAIRMAIAEILSNPLGLVPLVCIMIAVLSIAKKKGVLLLIASALMTVFSLSRLVGTISSILINYLQTFNGPANIISTSGFFSLNSLILAPVMALACSVSTVLVWFFFTLLIPACADGKLGFLRKVKKLIGALFTISVILMLICTLGSAARVITIDNILYPIWLSNILGAHMHLNMTYYITSSISAVVSVIATILFAIGLFSIASWMKKPTITVEAVEESSNDTADVALEENTESAEAVAEESAEAEVAE